MDKNWKIEQIVVVLRRKCINDYGSSLTPLYTDRYMREIAREIINELEKSPKRGSAWDNTVAVR